MPTIMTSEAQQFEMYSRDLARLAEARQRSDRFFETMLPEALYDRPIPERHRFVFYMGHLEAFDWNLIGDYAVGEDPFHIEFDRLFAFGIDPVDGNLPDDRRSDWPSMKEIHAYRSRVRSKLDRWLAAAPHSQMRGQVFVDPTMVQVLIEHRLLHLETLGYMLNQLPNDRKLAPAAIVPEASRPPVTPRMVEIPEGTATLGLPRRGDGATTGPSSTGSAAFGWDNEFQPCTVRVPSFAIDSHNVTNDQFLGFMRAGGYTDRSLWTEENWNWKSREGIEHPRFWRESDGKWLYRATFSEIPLPISWPVYVSHAEAAAYARWAGRSLPSEAQWHRAALGTPEGTERAYPWGDEPPNPRHGNFDFARWDPVPAGSSPAGESAFGVADMIGNGWEWTNTVFGPFGGFEHFPFYPGYSANFFDGKHYVMKGGSALTAACMLRRSFRNWFQPHYPNIYTTFRLVSA